jgi:hypothetical protein
LSISVRLRNLVRGGLGPIWAVSAIEEEEVYMRGYRDHEKIALEILIDLYVLRPPPRPNTKNWFLV